jgi:hypothetical protein
LAGDFEVMGTWIAEQERYSERAGAVRVRGQYKRQWRLLPVAELGRYAKQQPGEKLMEKWQYIVGVHLDRPKEPLEVSLEGREIIESHTPSRSMAEQERQ